MIKLAKNKIAKFWNHPSHLKQLRKGSGYIEMCLVSSGSIIVVGFMSKNSVVLDASVHTKDRGKITGGNYGFRFVKSDVKGGSFEESNPTGVREKYGFVYLISLKKDIAEANTADISHLRLILGDYRYLDIPIKTVTQLRSNRSEWFNKIMPYWVSDPLDMLYSSGPIMSKISGSIFSNYQRPSYRLIDIGPQPHNPCASVIIPIYRRFDFIRLQLSAFCCYGGMKDKEIIYVIDDPSIATQTIQFAIEQQEIYNIPIRLIVMEENVGFGMANNIGISSAKSENLLLLNSDVLPSDSNWADQLIDYLESLPNPGVLGVRLLYEDGSIQHDGMSYYQVSGFPGLFFINHPNKGLPTKMSEPISEPTSCDLVTAACMAIKKSTFLSVGGFDPIYPFGDFEDADLCLRLKNAGCINYICRDVVLYHLERQSQNLVTDDNTWRQKITLLNAITYNIRHLMDNFDQYQKQLTLQT